MTQTDRSCARCRGLKACKRATGRSTSTSLVSAKAMPRLTTRSTLRRLSSLLPHLQPKSARQCVLSLPVLSDLPLVCILAYGLNPVMFCTCFPVHLSVWHVFCPFIVPLGGSSVLHCSFANECKYHHTISKLRSTKGKLTPAR